MKDMDSRGEVSASKAIALVIGLTVFGLLVALLLPIGIDALYADQTQTLNQTTGTAYDVNGELESTVTAVTAGADATIELNDTRTAGTTSNTISVGDNATYSLEGGDVDVGVEESAAGYAVANYTYAKDYAYSGGASSLWGMLGLALVLAALLFVIGLALKATNRL